MSDWENEAAIQEEDRRKVPTRWRADVTGRCHCDCPAIWWECHPHRCGQGFCIAWSRAGLGEWPHRPRKTEIGAPCAMELLRKVLVDREID